MTPTEKNHAAKTAKADPAIMAILDALEADARNAWASSDLSETNKREIAYFQHLGVQQIRQTLDNWSREPGRTGDK